MDVVIRFNPCVTFVKEANSGPKPFVFDVVIVRLGTTKRTKGEPGN